MYLKLNIKKIKISVLSRMISHGVNLREISYIGNTNFGVKLIMFGISFIVLNIQYFTFKRFQGTDFFEYVLIGEYLVGEQNIDKTR